MKKLLQINVVANWGSTGKIAEEIGTTAIANGWESYIAYSRGNANSKSSLIKIGSRFDMIKHVLLSRFMDKHGLASKSATLKLIREIDEIKPDVIHLHNIHGYYLNYPLLFDYLKNVSIPVVWTIHDCWSFTGHCAHFSFAGCNKWQSECSGCPQLRTYPVAWFTDNSHNNYKIKKDSFLGLNNMTLVPVSDWLKGELKKSFFGEHYPVRRIYNGIDVDTFYSRGNSEAIRQKYGIKTEYMLMAAATTWSKRKGLDDIIKLAAMLDERFSVVVVGCTKEDMKVFSSNMIGLSRTESVEEMVSLYSAADVVLNLSYEETFGLTTAEGMACGTPSVVYDTTASPELIEEGTGKVVNGGDVEAVKHAVLNLVPFAKTEAMQKVCRESVVARFSKEERYKEYIDLYNSLIEGNKE